MCGIAGIVGFGERRNPDGDADIVRRMCSLESHRGPDDDGVVSLGRVTLGAVRLSIIDLSEAAHMPMADDTGDWWITYNGEVYNFAELREELVRLGHAFRSRSDTEVVLHAFREWGEAGLRRLVGMFAFAIHDRRSGAVLLVRDRFGIKPLYYAVHGDHLLFGSEMKTLAAVRGGAEHDERRLIEWFLYRNADSFSSETLIRGIRSVAPGEIVTIAPDGAMESREYYSAPGEVDSGEYGRLRGMSAGGVAEEVGSLLRRAVRERLVSDVPVGVLCSGGLDSSLVTAYAAEDRKDVTAFHVSVGGYPELDEEPFAREVARACGIDLVPYRLTGDVFRASLPRVIGSCDSPLSHPNSVAYYQICRTAREHGVFVLFSGEGADELFGGYSWRYRRYGFLRRARGLFDLLPRKVRRGVKLLAYASEEMPATSLHFDRLLPETVSFLDRAKREEWRARCEEAYAFVKDPGARGTLGLMLSDLGDFLVPLLQRLDRTSMAASVECRVPFLDHRVVRTSVNLPLGYKVGARADKWLLKRIASGLLPARVVHRPKMGFPLPMREYLAPLADPRVFDSGFCAGVLGLGGRRIDRLVSGWHENLFSFFNYLSLEIWGRLVILGEPLESVEELVAECEAAWERSGAGRALPRGRSPR